MDAQSGCGQVEISNRHSCHRGWQLCRSLMISAALSGVDTVRGYFMLFAEFPPAESITKILLYLSSLFY